MRVEELDIPHEVKEILLKEGIKTLYPPQEEAIKAGVLKGKNLVLSTPTASGKTLVAVFCALKHVIEEEGKVLYLTPLRALAWEKYEEFLKFSGIEKRNGEKVSTALSTGDYDSSSPWLGRYDIVVTTNEKCDSLLRHKAPWIEKITLVVADEVHLIGSDRGPTLEVILARMRQVNPNVQVLALSATVRNADEVADWLKAETVSTEWRPVELKEGVYYKEAVIFRDGSSYKLKPLHRENLINLALNTVSSGGQALIFLESRRRSMSVAKDIAAALKDIVPRKQLQALQKAADEVLIRGERTSIGELLASCITSGSAFHHAGLRTEHRRIIEDSFREGKIKVIAATPTLAAGVNLPARLVVIGNYRRFISGYGMLPISVMEYKQMCLPYDSSILLADGRYEKIGKIVDEGEDPVLITLNEKNNELTTGVVTCKFKRLAKEFVELEVQHGEKVRVTPNHPVLTSNGWKRALEVEVGERVAYITKIPYKESAPNLAELLTGDVYVVDDDGLFSGFVKKILAERAITKKDLAKNVDTKYKTLLGWANNRRKVIPLQIFIRVAKIAGYSDVFEKIESVKTPYGDPIIVSELFTGDFLWLAGLIATDGNLNPLEGSIRIRIFNIDGKIIEKACNVLEKLGIRFRLIQRVSGYEIELSNLLLGKILNEFGIPSGKKGDRLHISNIVSSMPKSLLSRYISGVFDGDGNYTEAGYVRAIRIVSKSRRFIYDLKEALLKLGIPSYTKSDYVDNRTRIRDKEAHFKGRAFYLIIRTIEDINKFFEHIKPAKRTKYDSNTTHYKIHSGEIQRRSNHITWSKVVKKRRLTYDNPLPVYNITVNEDGNYICNNLVLHNCGRAGRPQYDTFGEALLIAESSEEQDYLMESYVLAKPERLYSRLAAEASLRSHVLAAVASDYAHSETGLLDFFSRTFYAHQYDPRGLQETVGSMLSFLSREDMIRFEGEYVYATEFGRRVSELYIDPLSAVILRDSLRREVKQPTDFTYLHLVCHTPDMNPILRPRRQEEVDVELFLNTHRDEFACHIPEEWEEEESFDYEQFLGEVKTAMVLGSWIEEVSENDILEKYNAQPGDRYSIVQNAEWLLYAAQEIASILKIRGLHGRLSRLRERVKQGVKAELLPLVTLRGIGRVRGRVLYNSGLRTLDDLKRAPLRRLVETPLIGAALAKSIKEQVGGLVEEEEWRRLSEKEAEQRAITEFVEVEEEPKEEKPPPS